MGNRAVITFDSTPHAKSLGVYLHWNGGPESILAFAEALNHFKVRDSKSDDSYQFARFVQLVGNYLGGTLSLGVGTLDRLDCDNGDNGLYRIQRDGGPLQIWQSGGGCFEGMTLLSNDEIKTHSYWQPNEKGENIFSQVLAANVAHFDKPE